MILSCRERSIKISLCALNKSHSTLNEGGWDGDFEGKKLEHGSSCEDTLEISRLNLRVAHSIPYLGPD